MVSFENTSLPDIIEMKNINQLYGDKVVIKDLNLLIEDKPNVGQFIVILGQSGCGKSTLLRYVAGLQKPTSGEIFVNGKPQGNEKIGMVFQQYSSLPWLTVLENVTLGLQFKNVDKKVAREKGMELLKIVGLEGHENKYASYPILSGGQLQRVAIARSLATNPNIILMDEPFGALDINTRLKMQQLLCDMFVKLEPTIIFVTHDISEAVFLADEIWIMSANPGMITQRVVVDLPKERNFLIKRDPRFIKLVYQIEDMMIER